MDRNINNPSSAGARVEVDQPSEMAMVASKIEGNSIEPNLLMRLPIEIRQKIYRCLFRRLNKILPNTFSYSKVWRYGWAEEPRDRVPSFPDPRYIRWNTKATEEEMRLLDGGSLAPMDLTIIVPEGSTFSLEFGRWKLPDVIEKETSRTLSRIISRGPRGVEVHHQILMACPPLHGIGLLGVNKRISAEASDVLYGENTFGFDTRSKTVYAVSRNNRYYPADPHDPFTGGNSSSSPEMHALLNSLLGEGANASAFEKRDPLVQFLNTIGAANASKLRRIVIEGQFKLPRMDSLMQSIYLPCNLVEILPIHTVILQQFCQNIQFLDIHRVESFNLKVSSILDNIIGRTDPAPARSTTNETERMDRIIEKVVEGLPHLRQLRLDEPDFFAWGDVVKWEKVVEDRHNKRAEALALKKIEERRQANEAASQQA